MSEDSELAAIRARRLAEMQAQTGDSMGGDAAQAQRENAQRRQEEQLRHSLLARILSGEARERLSRIQMVKPERARALEDFIIHAARSGRLRGSSPQGQLTEKDLVGVLEQIEEQESSAAEPKITFQRRNLLDDDDDDF